MGIGKGQSKLGRWPKGQRRSPLPAAEAKRISIRIRKVAWVDYRGIYSITAMARYCGVDQRTARRWRDGDDFPMPDRVELAARWCDDPCAALIERAREKGLKSFPEALELTPKSFRRRLKERDFTFVQWRDFARHTYGLL